MSLALAAAVLVVILLALLVNGVFLGYPEPALDTPHLSNKEQAVVTAAAEAFFPKGGSIPQSATDAGAVPYFAALLGGLPFKTRILIRLLLVFVEHGPWIFNGRSRLTKQSTDARVQTLREWSLSNVYFLRISFQSLRTLVGFAYLADDAVIDCIGATPNLAPFERSAT